jgi:hypothetical protein
MRFSATPKRALVAATVGCAVALAACGDDPTERSESNYCTEVGNHLSDLNSPALAVPADIDRVIASWRTVARSAPLAIEAEWNTMVSNLETAATVDPNDPVSMQRVADSARSSEPAANLILTYTQQKCGADITTATPATTTVTTAAAAEPQATATSQP